MQYSRYMRCRLAKLTRLFLCFLGWSNCCCVLWFTMRQNKGELWKCFCSFTSALACNWKCIERMRIGSFILSRRRNLSLELHRCIFYCNKHFIILLTVKDKNIFFVSQKRFWCSSKFFDLPSKKTFKIL